MSIFLYCISREGVNFTPSLDMLKISWYNYTIADSVFAAIFNQVIIIEDLNLQTFFHTLHLPIQMYI